MSVTVERLMVEVQADVRDALRKLDQVERRGATMASKAARWGKSFGLMFGGAAVAAGFRETIGRAMTYDKVIRQVGIQTEQSGKKLERLSDLALKMGKDTVFSAQDAGGAMLELAKGGLSAATIRAGALEQSLKLAAAGGLELTEASTAIVNGMNAFSLKGRNASQIATALAGAANASSADVRDMTLALAQGSAQANATGQSIQETAAALAIFANNGVKGSDAGTTLKTMLQNLIPSTAKQRELMDKLNLSFVDGKGNFVGMAQIAGRLRKSMEGLSQAQRAQALRTIFGSDASRAALFLYKAGAKGVRDMTKATRDQSKVQEMANSAMEGASGAWENFKGSVETAAIQLGMKMLPAFTKAATKGGQFVDEAMTWGPAISETFGWVADAAEGAWRAIEPGIELAGDLVQMWSDLPGPVKETTVQVALAAALFPRLAAAATTATASVTTGFATMSARARQYAAEMTYATTRTQLLGSAAKTAAGIGGMVLLAKSADETSTSMKALSGAAAGGLLGFSVGGPWGAAIGAGAGALYGLSKATDSTAMSMEQAKGDAVDYAASLDQVTGATTRATRATIAKSLQERGVLESAAKLGIQTRDLVSSIMGQDDAQRRVNVTLRDAESYLRRMGRAGLLTDGMYRRLAPAIGQVRGFVQGMSQDLRGQQKETRAAGQAAQTWKEALKGVPPKVVTKLKNEGYHVSAAQLLDLKKRFDLQPKTVETIIKALGVEGTKRQIRELTGEAKKFGEMKPWLRPNVDDVIAQRKLDILKAKAREFGLLKPTPTAGVEDKASGRLAGILGLLNQVDGRRANAYVTITETVRRIGRTVASGLPQFDSGGYTGGRSPRDVAGVVHGKEYVMDAETTKRALPLLQAIHASKGRVFGYAEGGEAGKKPGAWAGGFVSSFMDNVRQLDAVRELTQMFNRWERTIRRNTDGDRQAALLKKSNAIQERMTAVFARSERIQKRLADAQEKLSNARQTRSNFISTTYQGMAQQATVLNAGNTASAIRHSLAVQVAKVKKFARMLRQLRKMGYGRAIVAQVAQAGVEGGYAAAEALVNASAEDRRAITESFREIQTVARVQAQALGGQLYDASVSAAQGLVDGLKKKKAQVRQTLLDIAEAYADAIRAAVGLKPGGGKGGGNSAAKAFTSMGSSAGLTTAEVLGGSRAGAAVTFNFVTHNPQAEPQSRTTNRALATAGALSLV